VITKPGGAVTLLNESGGRAAAIWTGNPTTGQRIGQWVDDQAGGSWNLIKIDNGYWRFQAAKNPDVYLTGEADAPLTLQNQATGGSQDWKLVPRGRPRADCP